MNDFLDRRADARCHCYWRSIRDPILVVVVVHFTGSENELMTISNVRGSVIGDCDGRLGLFKTA